MTQLRTKSYLFQDGVTSLPHGHKYLRPIYESNKTQFGDGLYSNKHLDELIQIENRIINKHPDLKGRVKQNSIVNNMKQLYNNLLCPDK